MKGTAPKRRKPLRFIPPPCSIRVVGDGWTRSGGYPKKVPNRLYHLERWIGPLPNGEYKNNIAARKNKRDYPEYEPIHPEQLPQR